jgi:transcriptional regulator with XRE-family HTH domain
MEHAKILKAFIKSRGVTQTFIAHKLGMNLVTLNNLLNGRVQLKSETLEAVCEAMNATPADFFNFKLNKFKSA